MHQKSNLHHVGQTNHLGHERMTPFLALLRGQFPLCPFRNDQLCEDVLREHRESQLPLNFWLECLRESDIDLVEYGRKETELYEQGLVSWVLWDSTSFGFEWIFILQKFTYGPSPSDWKVHTISRRVQAAVEMSNYQVDE